MGCESSKAAPAEQAPITPKQQRAAEKKAKAFAARVAKAAAKAKAAQEALVAAADAASPEVKAKVGHYYKRYGGPVLEPLFEHTDLVDVNYLIGLAQAGGVVPSWSDLPDCAKINTANLWRLRCWNEPCSLPILVLSCACTSRSLTRVASPHKPASHAAVRVCACAQTRGSTSITRTGLERRSGASCPS